MAELVTIGLPIYKRLNFLPSVLRIVGAQDYPDIELIISDNGMNAAKIPAIAKEHYCRPFKFRQNPFTVEMSTHFNQIIREASGKYFMILCDDDEISSNYVSELAGLLGRHPRAAIGLSKQEIIDESGRIVRTLSDRLPKILSGQEFIKSTWGTHRYKFATFASFVARTADLKASGGYPELHMGHSHDDALIVKLCLGREVALSSTCTFRNRVYESSHGLSISIADLATATKEFLQFTDSDSRIRRFASMYPAEWRELKQIIDRMNWETYYNRWKGIYRTRLTLFQWLAAAFALPFIPAYYRQVVYTLAETSRTALVTHAKKLFLHEAKA